MQPSELPDFTRILAWLSEMYAKPITSTLAEIYWETLSSFELEDVKQAFKSHVYNPDCGQYFPKPADIVRFISGSGETRALQAWSIVELAMYRVGKYQSIVFDDGIIHAVLEDMGGWVKVCLMTEKEAPFCAREFQKRYMGYLHKPPKRYPSYLCGILERDNNSRGYPVAPPLLVGDKDKAEQVMLTGGGTALLVHEPSSIDLLIQNLPISLQNDRSKKS